MRLRGERAPMVLGLVASNLLLAVSGLGLFARMVPAIDEALRRDAATVVVAEEIAATLTSVNRSLDAQGVAPPDQVPPMPGTGAGSRAPRS